MSIVWAAVVDGYALRALSSLSYYTVEPAGVKLELSIYFSFDYETKLS